MRTDGSQRVSLVGGALDSPQFTPDGMHVLFTSRKDMVERTWIVPLAGDGPARPIVRDMRTAAVRFLPDGRLVFRGAASDESDWYSCAPPDCADLRRHAPEDDVTPQLVPGCPGIERSSDGPRNFWFHPSDGGSPRQLTHFSDGVITSWAFSRDCQRFAVARGSPSTSDVVLLRNIR